MTRPLSDAVLDFIWSFWIGPTRKLPPIQNKILLMSATELAEKIRKRQVTDLVKEFFYNKISNISIVFVPQVSCEEVMRAYVDRSKAVHWAVGAVVDERYDDALRDAMAVDHLLASGAKSEEELARETPLLGLPFSCKEVIGVKGEKL